MAFPYTFPILFGRYTGQGDPQFPLRFPIMFGMSSVTSDLPVTVGLDADGRTQQNMEMQGDLTVACGLTADVHLDRSADPALTVDGAGDGHVGYGVQDAGIYVTASTDASSTAQLLAQADLAVAAGLEVAGGWAFRGTPTVEVQFDAGVRLDAVADSDPLALTAAALAGLGWPATGNNEPVFPLVFPIMFGLSVSTADRLVEVLAEAVSGWGIDPALAVTAAAEADVRLDALSQADLPAEAVLEVAGGWASRAVPTVEVGLDADVRLDALLASDPLGVDAATGQFQGWGLDSDLPVALAADANANTDQLTAADVLPVEAAGTGDLHPDRPAQTDTPVTAVPVAAASNGRLLDGPLPVEAGLDAQGRGDYAGQADLAVAANLAADLALSSRADLAGTATRPAAARADLLIQADLAVLSGGDTTGQYGIDTGTQVTAGLPAAAAVAGAAESRLPVTCHASADASVGMVVASDPVQVEVGLERDASHGQEIFSGTMTVEFAGFDVPLVRGAPLDAALELYLWRPNDPELGLHVAADLPVGVALDPVGSLGQAVEAELAAQVAALTAAQVYIVYGSAFLPFFYAQVEGSPA